VTAFTQTEADLVNKAYEQATTRIANLVESNEKRPSEIRQVAIDALKAHQEQIENIGFFEKDDFSLDEIKATIEAANAIGAAEDRLDDTHEFTLMELESDFAQVLQKLSLNQYFWMLKGHWWSAKRPKKYSLGLPDQIPEEVCDEFNVGVFNKTQGRLNQIAYNVRDVARRKCLNSDDYSPADFNGAVLNACKYSAQEATDNYIALQKLKAAERAAREENEVSIGGQIWDVIGWDSPTDFLWDVGLAIVTGGASKVVRWGKRIVKATQKASKAVTKLEKLLKIEERARKLEHRIQEVRAAAERLKKAKKFLELPERIRQAISIVNSAQGKLTVSKLVASKVTADYLRSVASSVVAKSTGMAGSAQVGAALSKEMAKASIIAYLNGTPLGKEITELKGKINYTVMIASGFNQKARERVLHYFALIFVREFIARMAITIAHKRTSITVDSFVNDFVDSLSTAVEAVVLEIPFVAEAKLKLLGRTIVTSIRKVISEIGKDLAGDIVAAIRA
jgi:hypothetical protein